MKPSCDWCERRRMDYAYLLPKVFPRRVLQPGGGIGWQLPIANSCSAVPRLRTISRGRAVWQARRVHTPKVAGSNPAFAICRERIINQLGSGNTVQRAPVARWVLFVMPIFVRRTRHQMQHLREATPGCLLWCRWDRIWKAR